jgi:cytochrome c5
VNFSQSLNLSLQIMSESHDHDTPIKTPKQLITVVVLAFVVPIFTIVLLVWNVTSNHKPAAGTDALTPTAVAMRIAPLARVEFKDPNAVKVLKSGEQVYKEVCTTCHGAGLAGSPKVGDVAAWAARIKTGYEALLKSAINGKGAMAPRGGNPDLDDIEIGRAIVFMTNQSGAKFSEPAAPAAPAPAATAPAASK